MSVYSTLSLSEDQAIRLIAKHMGVYIDKLDSHGLLAEILFKITDDNEFSPYRFNNYDVTDEHNPEVDV